MLFREACKVVDDPVSTASFTASCTSINVLIPTKCMSDMYVRVLSTISILVTHNDVKARLQEAYMKERDIILEGTPAPAVPLGASRSRSASGSSDACSGEQRESKGLINAIYDSAKQYDAEYELALQHNDAPNPRDGALVRLRRRLKNPDRPRSAIFDGTSLKPPTSSNNATIQYLALLPVRSSVVARAMFENVVHILSNHRPLGSFNWSCKWASVKKYRRLIFKAVTKYGSDFSEVHDVARMTVDVDTLDEVEEVVAALMSSTAAKQIKITRCKNRFEKSYNSIPSSGVYE